MKKALTCFTAFAILMCNAWTGPMALGAEISAASAVGAGTYENTTGAITFEGSWALASSGSDSGGSSSSLSAPGFAQIAFNETSVKWVARKTDYFGMANVYLDGDLVETVDLYSPSKSFQQVVYESPKLPRGVHTLRIERTGSKNAASTGRGINIDSFVVPDTELPSTPTGLTAKPSDAGVALGWTANTETDLAGYLVWRATGDAADFTQLTPAPVTTTSFTDPALTPGTTYRYRIAAVDTNKNQSTPTTDVSATTAAPAGRHDDRSTFIEYVGDWKPEAEESAAFGTISRTSNGSATLRFNERRIIWIGPRFPGGGVSDIKVDGVVVATVNQNASELENGAVLFDSEMLDDGVHSLSIETQDAADRSIAIDELVVVDTTAPTQPEGLSATGRTKAIELRWNPVPDSDLKSYVLSRRLVGSPSEYEVIAELPVYASAYTDTGVNDADTYRYILQTQDNVGNLSTPSEAIVAAAAARSGTVENDSSAIGYNGTWTLATSASDSGGSASLTTETNASAELAFTGTGVTLVGRKNPWSGITSVSIDGVEVAQVDLYSHSSQQKQILWSSDLLKDDAHVIQISRSGQKNDLSQGRGINIDAFTVTDSTAPPPPPAPTVTATRLGVSVTWAPPSGPNDVSNYRVYRSGGLSSGYTLVETVPSTEQSLLDVGLKADTNYRFHITAVDSSGNESSFSPGMTARAQADVSSEGVRYSNCPAPTNLVSTSGQLYETLKYAQAGDVIHLSPGVYKGNFQVAVRGTETAPVWLCGPPSAVIDYGDVRAGYGIHIRDSSDVRIAGITIQNALKGVVVSSSTRVAVSDLTVRDIGDEGIHLRSNTTKSIVASNSVSRTGRVNPIYGEGIYIGSDPSNWCTYSQCMPDRSDDNIVMENFITSVTAEGIEAKAGTTGGTLKNNSINGALITGGDGWIVVKGDSWLVKDNAGIEISEHGFLATRSKADGWGRSNVFVGNASDMKHATGVAVWVQKGLNNIVGCDNTVAGTHQLTNVRCQR